MAAWAIGPLRVPKSLIAHTRTCHLLSLSLPKPHASAAAILGDELDTGRFEGSSHRRYIIGKPNSGRLARFHPSKRRD